MRAARRPGETALLGGLAVCALLIHFLTNSRYGYFRDELYFIACARHLDWGYVDLAPLSALLLRLELASFGESLFAIRLFPALAGAATVALTALVFLAVGNFYSLNAFEPLFWMGCAYLLVRIINGASGGFWLGIGLLVGLGLENKHSMAFFGAGLVLATGSRLTIKCASPSSARTTARRAR